MNKFAKYTIFAFFLIVVAVGIYWWQRGDAVLVQPQSGQESELNSDDISGINSPPERTLAQKIVLDVPFTAQAPFGNWADARQDYGCEEAAILMAMYWVYGKDLPLDKAEKEIVAISDFEQENYGDFHDTSTLDTLKVLKAYFKYENAFAKFDIGIEDIKTELASGNIVIVPLDGTKVDNPYYTPPGPAKHKVVIRGYDDDTQEFITNDPGTKRGEGYRYNYQILENAIVDYPTGLNEPVNQIRTAMIVVKK